MLFAHPERELVVTFTRFVRELLRHWVRFLERDTRVTFFRLFCAVSVAEESRDGRAFDESWSGLLRQRRQLFLRFAFLAQRKVKQVKPLERRNVWLDGRLYLAIAIHWGLLGRIARRRRNRLWYVIVIQSVGLVSHQESLLQGIEALARHAYLFFGGGRRNEVHFVGRRLLIDNFRIHFLVCACDSIPKARATKKLFRWNSLFVRCFNAVHNAVQLGVELNLIIYQHFSARFSFAVRLVSDWLRLARHLLWNCYCWLGALAHNKTSVICVLLMWHCCLSGFFETEHQLAVLSRNSFFRFNLNAINCDSSPALGWTEKSLVWKAFAISWVYSSH